MSDPLDEVIETAAEKVEEAIEAAQETLVSLKPSKLTIILVCGGGIAAGICVGWYLAGGMKIEEEFYGGDAGAVSDVSADVVESDADVANGSDE